MRSGRSHFGFAAMFSRRAFLGAALVVASLGLSHPAQALDLDWSGQFRAEADWIHNYNLDSSNAATDATREAGKGYYIPGGGTSTAQFQTLFMRLKPKLIVNDNIYIKSEWWVGDPIYGLFGSGAPQTGDQRQYYSNQNRGSAISAQRFWAEILTDVGTVQVGRAPLNWGLGVVWNNGDGLWDRYESTGDIIRLISKFGAFTFSPGIVKYSMGNTVGGACAVTGPGVCSTLPGDGGVSEITLSFQYDNPDEDFEGGVNFIRRISAGAQDPTSGYLGIGLSGGGQVPVGGSYNTWDVYAKKKFGKFSLGGELPIASGDIGGLGYKTFGLAAEAGYKFSDTFETTLKAGHAPGQGSVTPGTLPGQYKAFYFNPNYRLGMIMFNYQLANFSGPQTQNNPATGSANLSSPYDNPIVNANYLNLGLALRADKWNFHGGFTWAQAQEAALANQDFYNHLRHQYVADATGNNQSTSLGWEMDYGTTFQWDDNFQVGLDMGVFFPGAYYKYSNTAVGNATDTVIAGQARVGITF